MRVEGWRHLRHEMGREAGNLIAARPPPETLPVTPATAVTAGHLPALRTKTPRELATSDDRAGRHQGNVYRLGLGKFTTL
jgi:hypothetical protein